MSAQEAEITLSLTEYEASILLGALYGFDSDYPGDNETAVALGEQLETILDLPKGEA